MTRRKLWGYSSNPDPCPTNHAVWILPLSGLLIDLRRSDSIVQENEDWPWDGHSLLFHHFVNLRIVSYPEISPSQFIFLLCLSQYSTVSIPYKLPISLYNHRILVIKAKLNFGKVSGSVVTCQYWIGRRLQILFLLYTVFLLAIRKYAVIRSPWLYLTFSPCEQPYTMITPIATTKSVAIHTKR